MIEIKNLTMKYKNGKGVSDISISVDNGEVKGLLGPNGSGKSTTMRSLMGFLKPSEGSLSVEGINTIENPVEAKKIIGYLPGDPQLPQNLSPKSLFKLGADMRGQTTAFAMELAEKFELEVDQSLKELSKGNRQKVAIILAVQHKPKALILDEPTEGIMPILVKEIRREIDAVRKTGVSILLVEQNIKTALSLCSRVYLMEKGLIAHEASSTDLEKDSDTLHRFLGVDV